MVEHNINDEQSPSADRTAPWLQRLRLFAVATLAGLLLSLPMGLLNRLYM